MKPVDALTVVDLQESHVWQYTTAANRRTDISVRPVKRLPVSNLSGKVVGVQVELANGMRVWGLLGNVDLRNERLTQHFLTISIERDGHWFHLARYHDFDFGERGPEQLAKFLGLSVDQIFPITYDIREYAKGDLSVLRGEITKEPRERLSRSEIIALAVP